MNKYGPVDPLGAYQTRATVGGHTWDVYRGSNGANQVYSFIRTGNINAGTVDVTAVAQWIRNRGWFGDVIIGDVQLGYEITSSCRRQDLHHQLVLRQRLRSASRTVPPARREILRGPSARRRAVA